MNYPIFTAGLVFLPPCRRSRMILAERYAISMS
jgi:hypothetical protein